MVGCEVTWGELLWLVAAWHVMSCHVMSFDVVVTSFDAMVLLVLRHVT